LATNQVARLPVRIYYRYDLQQPRPLAERTNGISNSPTQSALEKRLVIGREILISVPNHLPHRQGVPPGQEALLIVKIQEQWMRRFLIISHA
jgi:hypothetical protein